MKFLEFVSAHRLAAAGMSIATVLAITLIVFTLAPQPVIEATPEVRSPHDTNWSTVPDKELLDLVEQTFVEDSGIAITEGAAIDSHAVFGNGGDSILSPTPPTAPVTPRDLGDSSVTAPNDSPYAGTDANAGPGSLHS